MAKKSITQDLHGTKWKVHQDLADSPGLRFAQEYFSGYDWSQVEWVTVKLGEWGIPTGGLDENGGWTNAVAGKCQYPKKRGLKYCLNVRVNDRHGWPKPVYQRMSPIYVPVGDDLDYLGDQYDQAVEGQVAEDCILCGSDAYGDVYLNADETKMWKRMIRLFWLTDEDEALVYIIAHEAFHYLRRTRQIDGKNVEIEADHYAEGVLRAFQVLEEYLDSADQLRYRRARSIGGMGPQGPKDVTRDIARDLTELVGEIAALKGDANRWLEGPEYATLKHRLE